MGCGSGSNIGGGQPYSGHAIRQSLGIYSRDAQQRYHDVIGDFPV